MQPATAAIRRFRTRGDDEIAANDPRLRSQLPTQTLPFWTTETIARPGPQGQAGQAWRVRLLATGRACHVLAGEDNGLP
ncbi:MAG: hypothetical protein GXP27_01980 [Planctomycetes bacterium]|nr:hypothetical protein [Planctomycetota bacterium]